MRIAIVVLAAALVLVQATAPPDAVQERERAYRANNVGVARLEQFDYDAAARSFREALQIAPALHIADVGISVDTAEFPVGRSFCGPQRPGFVIILQEDLHVLVQ